MDSWGLLFKFIYELKQIFIWRLFDGKPLDCAMESLKTSRVDCFISVRRADSPPFSSAGDLLQGSISRCTPISKTVSEGCVSLARGARSSAR